MSPREIKSRFAAQRKARSLRRQRVKAVSARDGYKARKGDRGKLVMVGVNGQKDPQKKGRKGYLLYVTKTGKKWLIKQATKKEPYKPRKLSDIEPPARKNLRRASKTFQLSRREIISEHRAAIKGRGSVTTGGQFEFNDRVVNKIAKSLKKTIEGQASKRRFLINGMVLIELPDGNEQTFEFVLPIDKPDHVSIALGGLENFVKQKFYAFMARELAFAGFVSNGSANHIRRLADNKGVDKEDWTNKNGQPWQGAELEIVKIKAIDWRIEQIK